MSLVFGAITPHPPLLIENIGGENINKISHTVDALKKLEGELYAAKPETIFIISPHGPMATKNFYVNLASEFKGNLEDFGDFSTKLELAGDIELATKIIESTEASDLAINLINQDTLDHGTMVPLYYLTQHLPDIKIVPLSFCALDYNSHFEFGKLIKKTINSTNKRAAVIASGDLSHRLTKSAPAGYSAKGKEFDETLIKLLQKNDVPGILNLDPVLIEEAGECGLRSIIILLGIFNNIDYHAKIISYEGPFGVGYLVAQFVIN